MTDVVVFPGGADSVPVPDWSAVLSDPADVETAAQVWQGVVSTMRDAGTFDRVNVYQIRRYVLALVLYERAARAVEAEGPVVKAKRTKSNSWNPWFTVMKDANSMASDHEAELGLSPRRRGAVAQAKRKKAAGAADAYLKGAAGGANSRG